MEGKQGGKTHKSGHAVWLCELETLQYRLASWSRVCPLHVLVRANRCNVGPGDNHPRVVSHCTKTPACSDFPHPGDSPWLYNLSNLMFEAMHLKKDTQARTFRSTGGTPSSELLRGRCWEDCVRGLATWATERCIGASRWPSRQSQSRRCPQYSQLQRN